MPTDEVIALIDKTRTKWKAIGMSTAPSDQPRAKRSINALYLGVSLPKPRIRWLPSPREAVMRYSAEATRLGESIVPRLPKAGIANLPTADEPIVWQWAKWYTIRVHEAYNNAASDAERLQFDDFKWGVDIARDVTAAVWTRVGKLTDEASGFSKTFDAGSLNTGTQLGDLSFHEFWWAYRGVSLAGHPVEPLIELGEAAGWTLPFRNECWIIERPTNVTATSDAPPGASDPSRGIMTDFRSSWKTDLSLESQPTPARFCLWSRCSILADMPQASLSRRDARFPRTLFVSGSCGP